jgi:uracil-DNA glycosylase
LFYREGNISSDNRSNADFIFTTLDVHKQIIKKEIEEINPKVIVTLGNNSRNAVLNILGQQPKPFWNDIQKYYWEEIPILSIPHISGAANGTTSKIIKNHPDLTGYKSEKLAKLILKNL